MMNNAMPNQYVMYDQSAMSGQNAMPSQYTMPNSNAYQGTGQMNARDYKKWFINPDEEEKAAVKSGYLGNAVFNGILGKGAAVLTNRRFYFKGKAFIKQGNTYVVRKEETSVDLRDITSSGFVYKRPLALTIFCTLCILASCFLAIMILIWEEIAGALFFLGIPLFGFILYISKKKMYEIVYAGGGIALNASQYGLKDLREFDKKVRYEKDIFLSEN